MTLSGGLFSTYYLENHGVLIPLLVDDPLWVLKKGIKKTLKYVLIPLLVDDPLWDTLFHKHGSNKTSLNPSFSG